MMSGIIPSKHGHVIVTNTGSVPGDTPSIKGTQTSYAADSQSMRWA